MNLLRSSFFRAIIALILLSSWMGVYHHDAWLALSGTEHHHPSHQEGDHTVQHLGHDSHGHHHGQSHHDSEQDPTENQDSDNEDSIPLPDSHEILIAARLGDKESFTLAIPTFEINAVFDLIQICDLFSELVQSVGKPQPDDDQAALPAYPIALKDCVQSNAPPVLS